MVTVDPETSAGLAWRRLRAQRLLGTPCDQPADVVGRLVAVQAQDFGPAKWAVARRARGATEAQVDQAYAEGSILRTHVLRPTWHFVLPADIRWLLSATAPRMQVRDGARYRELGLDEATRRHSREAIAGALRGGVHLTRREAAATLVGSGISVEGQRLSHLLMDAEVNAVICSGAPRGAQHTYALLSERAPRARELGRAEAVVELARRYFMSHGPATAKDFAGWASLALADVKIALATLGAELRREVIDGVSFWSAADERLPAPVSPTVHFIQGYDEYIMGYSETKDVLARPGSSRRAATPPVGALVMLLDGRVAGFWKRVRGKGVAALDVRLLTPLDAAQARALQAEAGRYARYLGMDEIEVRSVIVVPAP